MSAIFLFLSPVVTVAATGQMAAPSTSAAAPGTQPTHIASGWPLRDAHAHAEPREDARRGRIRHGEGPRALASELVAPRRPLSRGRAGWPCTVGHEGHVDVLGWRRLDDLHARQHLPEARGASPGMPQQGKAGVQACRGVIEVCARASDAGRVARATGPPRSARAPSCSRGWCASTEVLEVPPKCQSPWLSISEPERHMTRAQEQSVHSSEPRALLSQARVRWPQHAKACSRGSCAFSRGTRQQHAAEKIEAPVVRRPSCEENPPAVGARQPCRLLTCEAREVEAPRTRMKPACDRTDRRAPTDS